MIFFLFQLFVSLSILQDSSFFVRSTFLSKTQKLLKEHKLPIRFACAFALAVTDGTDDLQYQVYLCLLTFYVSDFYSLFFSFYEF